MKPLIIAYILNIIDYIFTAYWVHKYGIEIEANPIGRWMFTNNVTWIIKILLVGGFFAVLGHFIYVYPQNIIIARILLAVFMIIVLYHITICVYIIVKNGKI